MAEAQASEAASSAQPRDPTQHCLSLDWVFGLNRDFKGAVHNLSDGTRKCIFYFIAHTGVIYDVTNHQQKLLQGHRNPIIASCMSDNRRFIVTADAGEDSIMIVWDTFTHLPVRFIHTQAYGGVLACAISHDAMYIATLSKQVPQTIALWAWTSTSDAPEHTLTVTAKDEQNCISFNPDDSHLVMTNGAKRVIFWSWAEGRWKFYSPTIDAKEVKQVLGNFTQSHFIPGTSMACSGTVDGDVVLWDNVRSDKVTKPTDKALLKVVRVHNGGVTFLSVVGDYIVTGGVEGFVRFLDHQLRIVAWFEELNGGPIISASFERTGSVGEGKASVKGTTTVGPDGATEIFSGDGFHCPDFVVSTANAMIIDVPSSSFAKGDTESQRGKLLVQGQDLQITAIAAHPSLPRLAIGGFSGNLHLWEYTTHKVILLSLFRNLLIQCLAFDPKATHLGVGFTNGVVKILDANSLEEQLSFKPKSPSGIMQITFSHDSQFFATADADGCVGLYKYTHRAQDPRKKLEYVYIGRHKAHKATVTGLQFGIVPYGDAPRLVSLGEDKRLVEYNLVESDIESGLRVRTAHKVTQGAVPTGLLWTTEQLVEDRAMPKAHSEAKTTSVIDTLLIATNEYKLNLHTTDFNRQCIKTLLGPTFGGPINQICVAPAQPGARNRCLVYSTYEQLVGLINLPLDGNPRGAMGLLAHPLEISSMCVSHDGRYLFTAGGRDCSVHQWRIDCDSLIIDGGSKLSHFIDIIEGGPRGAFMKEIIDYFFYAQIRAQGEETTKKRSIEGTIPFGQVPDLMRALGYYPSEKDIDNMTFEIQTQSGKPGKKVDDIEIHFDTFIRLYVNHRPVFGINKRNIEAAFAAIGADPTTGIVDRQHLFDLINNRGEKISTTDIEFCLQQLLGDHISQDMLEDKITAKVFAENLLGFEDYEEADDAPQAPAEQDDM